MTLSRSLLCFSAVLISACAAETSSPAVVDHFEVVQAPATGTPGRTLDSLSVVRLVDDQGAPIAGMEVGWSISPGNGSLASVTTTTAQDGTIVAQWTLGATGDTQFVSVILPGVPTLRVAVVSVGARATHLAVGAGFACLLDSLGDAWCWGDMGYGWHRFGPVPIKVDSGHALLEITAGFYSACARSSTATYCWGAASHVGRGSTASNTYLESGPVGGGMTFTQISTGESASCGIDPAGQAWCWGIDFRGNLGNSGYVGIPSLDPVQVQQSGQQFVSIASGSDHTCALEANGSAWC